MEICRVFPWSILRPLLTIAALITIVCHSGCVNSKTGDELMKLEIFSIGERLDSLSVNGLPVTEVKDNQYGEQAFRYITKVSSKVAEVSWKLGEKHYHIQLDLDTRSLDSTEQLYAYLLLLPLGKSLPNDPEILELEENSTLSPGKYRTGNVILLFDFYNEKDERVSR